MADDVPNQVRGAFINFSHRTMAFMATKDTSGNLPRRWQPTIGHLLCAPLPATPQPCLQYACLVFGL